VRVLSGPLQGSCIRLRGYKINATRNRARGGIHASCRINLISNLDEDTYSTQALHTSVKKRLTVGRIMQPKRENNNSEKAGTNNRHAKLTKVSKIP
jgi:hypothetical protein